MLRPSFALPCLLLSLLFWLPAQAQRPRPVPAAAACHDDHGSCTEDCTIEFGTSVRTRARLGACLHQCRQTHRVCTERWHDLHQAGVEPPPPTLAPAQAELKPPRPAPAAAWTEAPPSRPPPAAPTREQEDYNEGIRLPSDEQLRAPVPELAPRDPVRQRAQEAQKKPERERAKPSSRTHPEPPPEPEQDLSDWDPN